MDHHVHGASVPLPFDLFDDYFCRRELLVVEVVHHPFVGCVLRMVRCARRESRGREVPARVLGHEQRIGAFHDVSLRHGLVSPAPVVGPEWPAAMAVKDVRSGVDPLG